MVYMIVLRINEGSCCEDATYHYLSSMVKAPSEGVCVRDVWVSVIVLDFGSSFRRRSVSTPLLYLLNSLRFSRRKPADPYDEQLQGKLGTVFTSLEQDRAAEI